MTTATVRLMTGNLLCSVQESAIGEIDFPASVSAYCKAVEAETAPLLIEWDLQSGEGADKAFTDHTEESDEIDRAMEKVFSAQAFWVIA